MSLPASSVIKDLAVSVSDPTLPSAKVCSAGASAFARSNSLSIDDIRRIDGMGFKG